jgi:hypothetical protein
MVAMAVGGGPVANANLRVIRRRVGLREVTSFSERSGV